MVKVSDKNYPKLDITVLAFTPIIAGIVSVALNLNFFLSTLLFLGFPSIYLSYRTPKAIPRSVIFSSVFMVGALFIDHLAVLNNSWYVPHTIFSLRIFGTIPIEDVFSGFLLVYEVVIFYEHFFDKGKHKVVESYSRFAPYLTIPVMIIFMLLILKNPSFLKTDYFYLKAGVILGLFPAAAMIIKFPKYVSVFLKTAPYFFYAALIQEITALRLSHWEFPGRYFIGWVNIIGYKFPVEEFLFWLVLYAVTVISYFEFFDDAKLRKK